MFFDGQLTQMYQFSWKSLEFGVGEFGLWQRANICILMQELGKMEDKIKEAAKIVDSGCKDPILVGHGAGVVEQLPSH